MKTTNLIGGEIQFNVSNEKSEVLANRRRFIRLVGGGSVLAVMPLAVGCSSVVPENTVQAWATPKAELGAREFMLAHALLAPNPHNRQPWLADLRRPDEITLVCDKDRLLPETDPFGRQILLGCGAFIELATIAAAQRGYRTIVELFPQGAPAMDRLPGGTTVATLKLVRDTNQKPDPLFAQIQRRHTNKGAYDNAKVVAPSAWQQLTGIATSFGLTAGSITDEKRVAGIRQLTRASYETEMITKRTWLETANLLRIGPDEVNQHRDGIAVMGIMPRVLTAAGMFDRFAIPVRGDSNFNRLMERWAPFETGSGYYWMASKGNDRNAQVNSGRAYVRTHLQATALGVDMHPLSQAVQEFVEVRAQYTGLHSLLGFDAATTTVQMLCRVGYGQVAALPTPRRDLKGMIQV